MIKGYLRYKARHLCSKEPSAEEIIQAKKVLFVLLTRYGDTIISLVVIREFIERYPDKTYLILCPRQMAPYVEGLMPGVSFLAINKRNPLDMVRAHRTLKRWACDVGFSPWSSGDDAFYFISYCKKYQSYKTWQGLPDLNHYERVRLYLKLPSQSWQRSEQPLRKNYQRILVCPQSTDVGRSVAGETLDRLIERLYAQHPQAQITVAAMDEVYFRENCDRFLFSKSAEASRRFLVLVKESDLLVCADSGPLHIAAALGKDAMGMFNSTQPEQVLNTNTRIHCERIDQI